MQPRPHASPYTHIDWGSWTKLLIRASIDFVSSSVRRCRNPPLSSGSLGRGSAPPPWTWRPSQRGKLLLCDQVPAPPRCCKNLDRLRSRGWQPLKMSVVKPFRRVALEGHSLRHSVLMTMPSGPILRHISKKTPGLNRRSVQSHPARDATFKLVRLFLSDDGDFFSRGRSCRSHRGVKTGLT